MFQTYKRLVLHFLHWRVVLFTHMLFCKCANFTQSMTNCILSSQFFFAKYPNRHLSGIEKKEILWNNSPCVQLHMHCNHFGLLWHDAACCNIPTYASENLVLRHAAAAGVSTPIQVMKRREMAGIKQSSNTLVHNNNIFTTAQLIIFCTS